MDDNFLKYKMSTPAGDCISMLPAIKKAYEKTGRKAIIYQRLNMIGVGHSDSIHPFKDDTEQAICMPESIFNMMRPLLIAQDYIEDYIIYNGQEVDYDFDRIRLESFTNQPHGSINRWLFYAYPDLACDLSKEWLSVSECVGKTELYSIKLSKTDKICVNFSERYRNRFIHYFFLKRYESQLIFAGLPEEHERFCKEWGLNIPLLKVNDFLELAAAIKSCRFFMGNQSMCFQIAEALKVPRILETFHLMPNVIPIGEKAFDFYHQQALEYYFTELNK